jgi:hypothetical protein
MAYVEGLEQVLYNIDREINAMRGRTLLGMTKALNHLHRETETSRPLVPRDTNKMAQSWYIFPARGGVNPIVTAGYTAYYAPYVHEKTDALNWTRPGSGAKWLQIHFERNREEMKLIIAQNVMVKR